MGAQAEELSVLEVRAEQNSGEIQYFRFPVPTPLGGDDIVVHLGFRRSTDLDAADKPGQDYAVARGGDGYVVGVVADGVSQSFYGNLAARSVGERLLGYLWENRESPPASEAMGETLVAFQGELKEEVEQFRLSETLPSIQRQALETTRKVDGSQAVFSAFVLDGVGRSVHLYQVGDVVAFARDTGTPGADAEVIKADAKGRWSSTGRTKLRLQVVRREGVEAIIVKSDGTKDWGATLGRDEVNEQSFKSVADGLADYDDVSFVAAFIDAKSGGARHSFEGRSGSSLSPDGDEGRPVEDDATRFTESPHNEDAKADDAKTDVEETTDAGAAAVSIDGANGPKGDATADDRHRNTDEVERRNRVIQYLVVFTAGIVVGISLTVFFYFFLARAGLTGRAPDRREAGHDGNEAQTRPGQDAGVRADDAEQLPVTEAPPKQATGAPAGTQQTGGASRGKRGRRATRRRAR
jgi:hypothetical protein